MSCHHFLLATYHGKAVFAISKNPCLSDNFVEDLTTALDVSNQQQVHHTTHRSIEIIRGPFLRTYN